MPPRGRKPKDYDEQPSEETPEDQQSVLVHEAYLQHRLARGEPATPDAFLRAVKQFERLPGAVRTGPVTGRTAPPRSEAEPRTDGELYREQTDGPGETEGES